MASFNIEEGADTDPSWYGTFYKPGDQDWWDKGAHKALGQSFLRALVRQVAPELGTAEAGDLGMSDARCDMAVPIAFPDILSAAGAGLCILRAPEENITSMEELLPIANQQGRAGMGEPVEGTRRCTRGARQR